VTGLIAAMQIAPLQAADPARRFPYNPAGQTLRDLALVASDRPLLRAALGAMVFWTLGALAQVNVDQFVGFRLGLGQLHVGVLLGILAADVGAGSVLAGIWSAGRVELGIVSLGAAGIAASAILLSLVPGAPGSVLSVAYVGSCLLLFLLGLGAGLYQIPIQAFLQYRSPPESRGAILAASNFLAFSGMLLASAVLFWLASGPLGLRPEQIFLLLGVLTVPVFVYVVLLLPGATARCVVWLLCQTIYRVRIEGRENVPQQGGALVVANHVSFIDGVLLVLYFPRPLRLVARADPGHRWGFRRVAEDLGTIFIEPGRRGLVGAVRAAREALRQGDLVCMFPEGRITRTGAVDEFRPGFLAVQKKTAVPVIPIYLRGLWGSIFSFEGGRPLGKWPRRWPYPVSIVIGAPILHPTEPEQVRQAVAELGPEPEAGN
jgi:acyl-[acyl-carrier-protein]-phospholipid O-acyltransferase/long-chain-fatty-acid--[acyl-carrier-protein] ligase